MSYRTYVNNKQVFGNNEYYQEWEKFITSKGIEIDEDGCYEGEVDDVMGMFEVIDKITRRLINERHQQVVNKEKDFMGNSYTELTDLSNSIWLDDEHSILMFNERMVSNAYCFLPYQVYLAVEDIIEETRCTDPKWVFHTYKLKDGKKISVSGG